MDAFLWKENFCERKNAIVAMKSVPTKYTGDAFPNSTSAFMPVPIEVISGVNNSVSNIPDPIWNTKNNTAKLIMNSKYFFMYSSPYYCLRSIRQIVSIYLTKNAYVEAQFFISEVRNGRSV